MKIQVFLKINALKNFANFSGKDLRCRPSGLQLYQKETPTQVFSVTFLRTTFCTEQLQWLLFKISNINNLFKDFSAISRMQNQPLITCNSHNDKPIWKCIHLPKTCFDRADFERAPFFLKSDLNIINFVVLLYFLIT